MLSKLAGYVYYEGDTFPQHLNPYLPIDVDEPSLSWPKQKPLKGVSKDRIDAVAKGYKECVKMTKHEDFNKENVDGFFTAMCENIKSEKMRIGGDWVVAFPTPTRSIRDHIKKQLGPDLVFILLNMTKEEQMRRISSRHGDEVNSTVEWLTGMYDIFEPAHEDEENVFDVVVTGDMSREDVARSILDILP